MYGDMLYTPNSRQQWGQKKDRSMTFSQLNKSHSGYKSTEYGSPSPFRSGAVSRLEEAKKTIDSVIGDLGDQRDMNQSAFREVKSVNTDILEEFKRSCHFDKENASTYCPDYKSQQASTNNLHSLAPQEDGSMLKSMLNEQMRKNSGLLLQMSRMQEENQRLRQQGGNSEVRQLQAQNQRLKMALSQVSSLPQEIFSEIQGLKRENQQLRTDTVKLLHKANRII